MKIYNIAVYPGDGIGIEVIREAVKALKALETLFRSFKFNFTEFDWGSNYWKKTGRVVPDNYLETLKGFDAILLGALGDPANIPDHVTLVPIIQIRQSFDQYVCLRPAKILPGVKSPLADKKYGDVDLIVIRENSEGEYTDVGGIFKTGQPDELAIQTAVHTRKGIARILRYAFSLARERKKHLTLATKSNAQKYSMVLWDRMFAEIAGDFPNIQTDKFHVDALAMNFVRFPERFDVVVGSNLFGDILSDLAGIISGSLGLVPSANINPEKVYPSFFEPVHGSAPDIAGKNIANPLGAIRSTAMMVDFLGEKEASACLEKAVLENLTENKIRTPDIEGKATTDQVGTDICEKILKLK